MPNAAPLSWRNAARERRSGPAWLYLIGLTGAVGTAAAIPVAAAWLAIRAAAGALVLLINPASGGTRSGSLTIAEIDSPAFTVRIWLAASSVWSFAIISTM